jgi:hypothetical protein
MLTGRAFSIRFRGLCGSEIDMNLLSQIGGGSKTLNQGDGAGGGLCASQAGLFNQKGENDAVGDLQNRRKPMTFVVRTAKV